MKILILQNCIFCLEVTADCVKSVRSRSYSGPHFPAFRPNKERYSIYLRIQSECWKMRTRITRNTEIFMQPHMENLYLLLFEFLKSSLNKVVPLEKHQVSKATQISDS